MVKIERRFRLLRACYKRFDPEVYDVTTAPLSLEVCMLKADVVETLLYECVTWTLNMIHYGMLQKVLVRVLPRILRVQRRADHTKLSYVQALVRAPQENEMRKHRNNHPKRRLFFEGAMVWQNKGRLPSRMMSAQTAGGKNPGSGGPPNNWLSTLRDDLAVFRSTEGSAEYFPRQFGFESALWVHAAKKAGKWHRGVLEAAERFMAR